jgi:chemotaxis protein CheD
MSEIESEVPQVYLNPGEFHLARSPAVLRTLLGSCIGITFWSGRLAVGALCHAMLPRYPANPAAAALQPAHRWRYVDFCIRDLARQFDALGAHRSEIEIKLFGGADVLPVHAVASYPRTTVGRLNCRRAQEILQREGLKVVASDLGGSSGRNIQFHTGTGEVLLRRLAKPIFEDSMYSSETLFSGAVEL